MGVGSIIVGIAAFLFMFGGFLTSVIPFLGTLLSFGAPMLALAGIVMGGLALSRAKRDGEPTGAPTAGLILNIVALIPALVVALTCGLCNACISAGVMNPQQGRGQPWIIDGGASPFGPGTSPFGPGPSPPGPTGPGVGPKDAGPSLGPPPAFPPPPMGDDTAPDDTAPDDTAPSASP